MGNLTWVVGFSPVTMRELRPQAGEDEVIHLFYTLVSFPTGMHWKSVVILEAEGEHFMEMSDTL